MRRLLLWPPAVMAAFILFSPSAKAELIPRFTLIELNYPQIAAASVGLWALSDSGAATELGLLGDVQAGLSGPKVALGLGLVSSPKTSYEKIYSVGVQAVAHRTWPSWSPFLPTSRTYVGVEAFAHFFALRCSVGAMWPSSSTGGSPIPSVGCGIGLL